MKEIKLTKNQFAIVDDEDYERLKKHSWQAEKRRNNHYARGRVKSKLKYMHRIIMNCPDKMQIDHINHNTLDNRKINLRIVNSFQNNMNSKKRDDTTSIHKGVCWTNREKRWRAYITYRKNTLCLGYYKNEKKAALIYNKKAIELFGKYACLNNIES